MVDISESMSSRLKGVNPKQLTIMDVSLQCLDQVHNDIVSKRKDDVITIVVFNDKARVVRKGVDPKMMTSVSNIFKMEGIIPKGRTNISRMTTEVQKLVVGDPGLTCGKYEMVEIAFTDGKANEGLSLTGDLIQHKQDSLNLFKGQYNIRPYAWYGAIGSGADWRWARGMASTNHKSMWAHISEDKIEDFASEAGGIVSTVLNSTYILFGPDKEEMMLLAHDTSYYYFPEVPTGLLGDTDKTIKCDTLVKVYEIYYTLLEKNKTNSKYTKKEHKFMKKTIKIIKSTNMDILNHLELMTVVDKVKELCLVILEEMKASIDLSFIPKDLSLVRAASSNHDDITMNRVRHQMLFRSFSDTSGIAENKLDLNQMGRSKSAHTTTLSMLTPPPLPSMIGLDSLPHTTPVEPCEILHTTSINTPTADTFLVTEHAEVYELSHDEMKIMMEDFKTSEGLTTTTMEGTTTTMEGTTTTMEGTTTPFSSPDNTYSSHPYNSISSLYNNFSVSDVQHFHPPTLVLDNLPESDINEEDDLCMPKLMYSYTMENDIINGR